MNEHLAHFFKVPLQAVVDCLKRFDSPNTFLDVFSKLEVDQLNKYLPVRGHKTVLLQRLSRFQRLIPNYRECLKHDAWIQSNGFPYRSMINISAVHWKAFERNPYVLLPRLLTMEVGIPAFIMDALKMKADDVDPDYERYARVWLFLRLSHNVYVNEETLVEEALKKNGCSTKRLTKLVQLDPSAGHIVEHEMYEKAHNGDGTYTYLRLEECEKKARERDEFYDLVNDVQTRVRTSDSGIETKEWCLISRARVLADVSKYLGIMGARNLKRRREQGPSEEDVSRTDAKVLPFHS